jgi:hypothetical protein
MSESSEQAIQRYSKAAHAMQTAVAVKMEHEPKETEPKHLRVGINSALSNTGGLVTLLIEKGVFTLEEYHTAMADAMERESGAYYDELLMKGYIPPNADLA